MAVGLDKDRYFFHEWFTQDSLSQVRVNHNSPRIREQNLDLNEQLYKFTTPQHLDEGFLTILTTLGYPGLQIEVGDNEYKTVKNIDNQLIINVGAIFSHITNYQLKATWHRVLDIGIHRYSCPFFLVPKYMATIPSNYLQPDQE